ncbi:MAG: hypothetical protein HDR41_04275 [Lactobacillus sp.]|nr:hypothetical protein [Lactobacillus sp.]
MEKKELLEALDDVRKEVEEGRVTDLLISYQCTDGNGVCICADPVPALGIAQVLKIQTEENYKEFNEANRKSELFGDFMHAMLKGND